MADRNDQGGARDNERMGRGVKEGLNAGQSRNAHESGSRGGGSTNAGASDTSGASGGMQGAASDRGRGGYGDDSGFTGGSRSADEGLGRTGASGASGGGTGRATSGRSMGDESDALEHNSPHAAAAGSEGANVEDHSRIDGVGHQAPSGMDERESTGETR